MRAWVTRLASSSAVKTVLTASARLDPPDPQDRRRQPLHRRPAAAWWRGRTPASAGPSHSTARSGPARVRFFGTISPTTVCRKTTTPRASMNATGCAAPSRQPERVERRLQQVGQRRLGDRAQAQRADRDAELGAGDHQRDLVHRPQRRAGPAGSSRPAARPRCGGRRSARTRRRRRTRCRAAAARRSAAHAIGRLRRRPPGPARPGAARPRPR